MRPWLWLLLAVWCAAGAQVYGADAVVVGHLADLSGATASVGIPYAEGVRDCVARVNAHGGIGGRPLRLVQRDYGYRVASALAIYREFRDRHGVVAIQGWGSADTSALMQQTARDEIPYFSAGYAAEFTDPTRAPYNFVVAADYSTMLRAGLRYLRDAWSEARAPTLAFIYPDNAYGRAPLAAGRQYAKELGFRVVAEETLSLESIEASRQILALKKARPDFAWLGGTTPSTAVVLKDARMLGLETQFFTNIWGNDASLFELAEGTVDGLLGLQVALVRGEEAPGTQAIDALRRVQSRYSHYLRGWISTLVMVEGMHRAAAAGDLSGRGIRQALETLRDYDPGGLTAPITYTAEDHRPNLSVRVYRYGTRTLTLQKVVTLERRPQWLGR